MESQELKSKDEKKESEKDVALLQTEKGNIKIKLYLKEAPITAETLKI